MTDLANAHFKPLRRKTSTRAQLSFIGLQLTWPDIGEVNAPTRQFLLCYWLPTRSLRRMAVATCQYRVRDTGRAQLASVPRSSPSWPANSRIPAFRDGTSVAPLLRWRES